MSAWVALLGAKGGPAIRPGSSMPTSSLARLGGRLALIDAGLGAAAGVTRQGVELTALDLIVVTHLHSDHVLELGPLIHTAWTAGLRRPLTVLGPPGLARAWEGFVASMAWDIDLRIADEGRPDLRDLVRIETLREDAAHEFGPLRLRAMRNDHPPVRDSFALRLEAEGLAVVFSGDTAPMERMADFAAGADLLVHEALLEEAVDALCARVGNGDERLRAHIMRSHTRAEDAARIAARAGVRALALNHLIPADDPAYDESHWRAAVAPHWSGPLHIARDGLRIDLGPQVAGGAAGLTTGETI